MLALREMAENTIDHSVVVGAAKLARLYKTSWPTAKAQLVEWYEEQQKGGPVRVFKSGKRLYTTLAVIQRERPVGRDQYLVRKIEELENDLNVMARRIERLTSETKQEIAELRRMNTTLSARVKST